MRVRAAGRVGVWESPGERCDGESEGARPSAGGRWQCQRISEQRWGSERNGLGEGSVTEMQPAQAARAE